MVSHSLVSRQEDISRDIHSRTCSSTASHQFGQQPQQSYGQPQLAQNTYQQGFPPQGDGQQPPQPKEKKPLSKKKIGIICGAAAVVVAAVLLIFVFKIFGGGRGASTSEEAAVEFLKAWADNDIDEMIKYSLPKELESAAEKYVKSDDFAYYYKNVGSLEDAYEYYYIRDIGGKISTFVILVQRLQKPTTSLMLMKQISILVSISM